MEDIYTGINLKSLEKIIGGNLDLEEVSSSQFMNTEKFKYKILTDKFDTFIFPTDKKIGIIKIKTMPSGDDYYSGREYTGDLYLKLKDNNIKISYRIVKEEMAENILERKDYIKKFGLWVKDKEKIVEQMFPSKKILN